MYVLDGIFLTIISGLSTAGSSNVTFFEISNDVRFNGLVLDSGFIKKTRQTGNDKASCGASCVAMADCVSFFIDTSASQCQFHDTILRDTTGLTISPSSLYFFVDNGDIVCPVGWVSYQKACFFFETSSMTTYSGAKDFCQGLGGKVLRVDTIQENEFIKQHLQTIVFVSHGFWLGLTDVTSPGTWIWEETGTTASFTDWELSQPENNDEHCTVIQKHYFRWHDVVCSDMCHPACRIE